MEISQKVAISGQQSAKANLKLEEKMASTKQS
jgi:hypothetical protein